MVILQYDFLMDFHRSRLPLTALSAPDLAVVFPAVAAVEGVAAVVARVKEIIML
jgi:hypothetical protein